MLRGCQHGRWLLRHTIFELSYWISSQKRKSLWNRFCLFIWGHGWELASFWQKMSNWVIHSKKTSDLLIFGEQPERYTHGCSFLVSELCDKLTMLFKKEGMSKFLFILNNLQKTYIKIQFYSKSFERIAHFLWAEEQMSDLLKKSVICSFSLLSWAPWSNC